MNKYGVCPCVHTMLKGVAQSNSPLSAAFWSLSVLLT